nr:MAG TPA: hypothetical protein [Bacteriophage sp.]
MLCLYIRLLHLLGVQVYPVGAARVLVYLPKLVTASTTRKGILYPFYTTLSKTF